MVSKLFFCLLLVSAITFLSTCQKKDTTDSIGLSFNLTRLPQVGLDPFRVRVTLTKNSSALAGQSLTLTIPKGSVSAVTDNADGTYDFIVTPSTTGTYPVTVTYGGQSFTRKAVVLDSNMVGTDQPTAIPGDYVNTEGYEDGVTITPDGQYLFVQYGPFYFAGIANYTTICASGSFSVGYDLNSCEGRTNSDFVFNTIGPMTSPYRPDFPSTAILDNKLRHVHGLVQAGVINGLAAFPTFFYGFKLQANGEFAEPFQVGFNDERGLNGPFGLSFKMNGDGTAKFVVAWNNYFNDLGDDKPDIYAGTITLGQKNSFGTVAYNGDIFNSITPIITPVSFSTHAATQGNPHMYYDSNGTVQSIWTDDEQVTFNLSVYRITAGTFPSGTWVKDTLPAVINTGADERQPFFTGDKLIFTRNTQIVYHDYLPTNGACSSTFTHADCWGPEVVLIGASGHTNVGEIFGVGEPTVATRDGKKYLYFVYVEARSVSSGIIDWNLDAASVEIP
jgi:hypothetical protein